MIGHSLDLTVQHDQRGWDGVASSAMPVGCRLRGIVALMAGLFLSSLQTRCHGEVYYVNSQSGDDKNTGTSSDLAWKSLEPVNEHDFQPGDQLLFEAGTRYTGQLRPKGSGAIVEGKLRPVVIRQQGEGARPRIDGEGRFLDTVLLRNVEFWEVNDLEITNQGDEREPWRTGVHVVADGFGRMRHIHLRNLFVHDVNGDLRKSQEGCGIYFESRGRNGSHFDDLLIENCHVARTDRNGICQRNRNRTRSLNVVIRGNLLEDIGGDGIKLWGSNGGLIEGNIVRGGRMRCEDYAAGIWPFDCDDTVIQFNEVSEMKGVKDGQAFDSDYRCRRSVFQYNYSHDNEGGFMLICAPGNSYNEGTIIRYNISQNDGTEDSSVFHFGGGVKDTQVYNNTIYVGPEKQLPLLLFTEWDGGKAERTRFLNNIFYVDGRVTYKWGESTNSIFLNNAFFGRHGGRPTDPRAVTSRPPLIEPGSGGNGIDTSGGYKLSSRENAWPGRKISANGGRDFFGHPLPVNRSPCIGAAEFVK